jgi:hypothetical protein
MKVSPESPISTPRESGNSHRNVAEKRRGAVIHASSLDIVKKRAPDRGS